MPTASRSRATRSSELCTSTWPPEAAKKPRLGGLFDANLERIVSLKPDLAVLLPSEKELADKLRLSTNYAYLDATQPDDTSLAQVHELRRPKHSGSVALDGTAGKLTYGGSLAYVGSHFDQRDTFPFDRVTLGSYWLADARIAYAVRPGFELFARVSNALNQRYEDVFGYRTERRAAYAGIRLSRL